MKKIYFKGLDVSCYKEVLDNGLEVFLIPFTNKKNYFMAYATRFGSEITNFIPAGEDKEIKVPDGIAHFLEHKMFEQEDGIDPFTYFSKSGTGANAFTSFDRTQYICYGTKNFNDNLAFLLSFVDSPYYTDENVEKEKGIIAEELNMYADMPDWQIETKLREAIYVNHPRRIDIGGTVSEINKITKEDLYTCYNNFYSPNNMFLLLVGNFNIDEARDIINEEMKSRKNMGKPVVAEVLEEKKVNVHEETFYTNVKVPKVAIGLKVPTDNLSSYDDLTLDLYLQMFSTLAFGSSSLFRERVRNKKLLNSFSADWESIPGFKNYLVIVSTDNPDEFIDEFKNEINNISISEEAFNRMKKVWISSEVKLFDYVDSVASNVSDDLIRYGDVIPDKIEKFRKLNIEEMNDIISKIDFDNISYIKCLDKEE